MQNIFVLANKRKQVPSNHDANKLQSFFNCAATLMTSHLQSLALVSMSDFTDLLCRPPVSVFDCVSRVSPTSVLLLIIHGHAMGERSLIFINLYIKVAKYDSLI